MWNLQQTDWKKITCNTPGPLTEREILLDYDTPSPLPLSHTHTQEGKKKRQYPKLRMTTAL